MRIVALIPARGGSKGIPKKNLQVVSGKTLVALRIEQAKKSRCSEVYVSTDDAEIANEARKFGALIIDRPTILAQDESSTDAVLKHAIEFLNLGSNDIVVLLQPTSPFISYRKINECLNLLMSNLEVNSVITLKMGHEFIWRDFSSFLEPVNHERLSRKRRQDLHMDGSETGGCYAIKVSGFFLSQVRFPAPTLAIPVNIVQALDIDSLVDLRIARELTEFKNVEDYDLT